MSDADRRAFVNDPKRAQVTDARATGTSKAPFTQQAAPQDPLADPRRDEDDYDDDVQRIRPITWDITELGVRVDNQLLTFFERQTANGHSLCYPTLDFPVIQGDDHWLAHSGEQRFVRASPQHTYIFEVGARYPEPDGIVFLDYSHGTVSYKVPGVRYRECYWGINREMPAAEFVTWLNYNPAPLMALAELYEGAIMGDAIKDPTIFHLAGQVVTAFIPVVDQIADARDTLISLYTVASSRGAEGKLMLGANITAWIPFGDLVGLVPRIGKKLKGGDVITAIARQKDGKLAALVRRGDEVLALTDEAEAAVAKGVSKKLLQGARDIERKVFCGAA